MPLVIPINQPVGGGATVAHTGVAMAMPMRIGASGSSLWLLPLEPLVSVKGSNVITRRMVSKWRKVGYGSVKETWTQNDYEVSIEGVLYDHTQPDNLPSEMISKLQGILTQKKPIIVECDLFSALGLAQLAVFDWDFPATQAIGYQNFIIKAYSDQDFNLLIEQ